MKSSLRNLPFASRRRIELDAEYYNRTRLALRRLENPIRLSLPGVHGTDLLIDDETWIATDRRIPDRPVLALTDFIRVSGGLHAPVRCQVFFYRSEGELLLNRLLATMHRLIEARLVQHRLRERRTGAVVEILSKR